MTKHKMSKSLVRRIQDIGRGRNKDASDEYYTLYHAFAAAFLELLCRHKSGTTYKVIICPCDSQTSVFRELEHLKHLIGDPRVIYSFWPEKDWADYFDMDYYTEYGCSASEVCIFTNPPFKGIAKAFRTMKCDYLVFGSTLTTTIIPGHYCKQTKGFKYIKNTMHYSGTADTHPAIYGCVPTSFFSNKPLLSYGVQWQNRKDQGLFIGFKKDQLTRIDKH